jgi:hypothetical protein
VKLEDLKGKRIRRDLKPKGEYETASQNDWDRIDNQ